jgi:acyl-CoA dehydrogenase
VRTDKSSAHAANHEENSAVKIAESVVPELARHVDDVDRSAHFPVEAMQALRQTPLMGLMAPPEYGGLGGSLTDLVNVSAVLVAGCPVTAFIWAMHCQQVYALARHAGPRLAAAVLPRITDGEVFLGSVTTEPGSGGRLLTSNSPALRDGDRVEFERFAPIVTGARHADAFLITLRSSEEAPSSSVTLVYAERADVQITESHQWEMLGMRGTENISARLQGSLPAGRIVGDDGGFGKIAVESMIPAGHIGWAACWIASARVAFGHVLRHLRKRATNSGEASFDLKAVRLARIRIALDVADTYLRSVAAEIDAARLAGTSLSGAPTQIHLNALKVMASEVSYDVANQMIELCGFELGYTESDARLGKLLRDLRSAAINYSNDRLLSATGRLALLDPRSISSGAVAPFGPGGSCAAERKPRP